MFNDYDAPAVRWALHTALDLFKDRDSWLQMMRNAMAQDFSWDRQSRAYVQLYAEAVTASTALRLTVPVSWNGIFFSMEMSVSTLPSTT